MIAVHFDRLKLVSCFAAIFCCVAGAQSAHDLDRVTLESLSIGKRPPINVDAAKAQLGRALFTLSSMSPVGRSCSSCHPAGGAQADTEPFRPPRLRRAPVLVDVGWNRWFFWDGRAASLEVAILEPLTHKEEVAATAGTIRAQYKRDTQLRQLFDTAAAKELRALSDDEVLQLCVSALANYLRTLQSAPSRFDKFVAAVLQDQPAVTLAPPELDGLRLFMGKGKCVTCHNTWRFTDGEFHNLRLLDHDGRIPTDPGRMAAIERLKTNARSAAAVKFTPREVSQIIPFLQSGGDQFGQFKTPSLRNLADGAPLMHQGQLRSLRDVVQYYSSFSFSYPGHGSHDLLLQPLKLNDAEVDQLVAFLKTLRSE